MQAGYLENVYKKKANLEETTERQYKRKNGCTTIQHQPGDEEIKGKNKIF